MNTDSPPVMQSPETTSSQPTTPRPALDTASLRQFLDSIRSFAGPELILESSSVPRLYHYTDLGGLIGIVTTNDLWLTHLRFSNDDEELTHGQRIVAQTLAEEQHSAVDEKLEFLRQVEQMLSRPAADGVYICCLCAKNNVLSQWRGYGANGTGVSIELNHSEFVYLTGPDCSHGLLRLWKVFYDENVQRGIVRKAIEFAWLQSEFPLNKRVQNAADAIEFFIPTFKNRDFEEENEWRLIFSPTPNAAVRPRFRAARNMIIPYHTLQGLGWSATRPLPITGLLIGPSANKELSAQGARLLLQQHGYADCPVRVSQTPYRG